MSEWKPIETAPSDTEIVVYAPTETPSVFTAMKFEWGTGSPDWGRYSGGIDASKDDYFGDPDFYPTHWMPLPAPPAPSK
jgi:hypothetical protein